VFDKFSFKEPENTNNLAKEITEIYGNQSKTQSTIARKTHKSHKQTF